MHVAIPSLSMAQFGMGERIFEFKSHGILVKRGKGSSSVVNTQQIMI